MACQAYELIGLVRYLGGSQGIALLVGQAHPHRWQTPITDKTKQTNGAIRCIQDPIALRRRFLPRRQYQLLNLTTATVLVLDPPLYVSAGFLEYNSRSRQSNRCY